MEILFAVLAGTQLGIKGYAYSLVLAVIVCSLKECVAPGNRAGVCKNKFAVLFVLLEVLVFFHQLPGIGKPALKLGQGAVCKRLYLLVELFKALIVLKLGVVFVYKAVETFASRVGAHRESRKIFLLYLVNKHCPRCLSFGRAAVVAVQNHIAFIHRNYIGVSAPEPYPQRCVLISLLYCHADNTVVARLGALCYPAAQYTGTQELGKALQLLCFPNPAVMPVYA